MVSSDGAAYGLILETDEGTDLGCSVGSSEGSNDGKLYGSIGGISLVQGERIELGSSYEYTDGITLDLDRGINVGYSFGSFKVGCIFRRNSVCPGTFLSYPAELCFPMPPENGKGMKRNATGMSPLPALQFF